MGSEKDRRKPTRRRDERVKVNREFESIEEFISEYVSDISRSGVFIKSDDPLPVGTKVDLRFTVIVDDFETIEGIGEVTRVVPPGADEPPGMGVVFTELTPGSKALIDRILQRADAPAKGSAPSGAVPQGSTTPGSGHKGAPRKG